jgi:hypothetical protein
LGSPHYFVTGGQDAGSHPQVAVALAAKLARIAWVAAAKKENYRAAVPASAARRDGTNRDPIRDTHRGQPPIQRRKRPNRWRQQMGNALALAKLCGPQSVMSTAFALHSLPAQRRRPAWYINY